MRFLTACLGVAAVPGLAPGAQAAVDGSEPVICAAANIMECFPDGNCERIDAEDAGIPRFFRIDFEAKKMYWADEDTIRRANLDGTDAETLVSIAGMWARGIAIDLDGNRMYFTDASANPAIRRAYPAMGSRGRCLRPSQARTVLRGTRHGGGGCPSTP